MLCSDGLWSGISDDALIALLSGEQPLEPALLELAEHAVKANAPGSDNTSAVALRLDGRAP